VAAKAVPLGLRVVAYDPNVSQSGQAQNGRTRTLVAEWGLRLSARPLNEQTREMVGRSLLVRLKPGAALINTARGGLIDEASATRRRAGDASHGPHTAEATAAMGAMALDDLLSVLSGQPPKYPL